MMTKFCCAHISKIMKIKICTISDFWAFEITKIVIENIKILSKITKFVHLAPLDEFRASQQKISKMLNHKKSQIVSKIIIFIRKIITFPSKIIFPTHYMIFITLSSRASPTDAPIPTPGLSTRAPRDSGQVETSCALP